MKEPFDFYQPIQDAISKLTEIKNDIHSLAGDFVLEGELSILRLSPIGEGYPFNINDYIRLSDDPDVQALTTLIKQVDDAIEKIKTNNTH